jgi:arabinogalactan endo-1,4-beta-galactosidase
VLASFMTDVRKIEKCLGVFYWEPQVNGSWKPEIYNKPEELTKYTGTTVTSPWGPYNQGAFKTDYSPSSILDSFAN